MLASRAIVGIIFVAFTCAVSAQELFRTPIVEAPMGSPALGGAVLAGSDTYLGEPRNYDQIPLILYEGERIFAYGNSLGFNFVRNETFRFGALARARLTSVDPTEIAELEGLSERRNTLEAGLMANVTTPFGQFSLTGVRDAVGRYDGDEIDLSYRLPIHLGQWTLTPWVSALWQDERLTGYYYGVSQDEAAPGRPAYTPGAARNFAIGLNTAWHVNDRFFMFANVGMEIYDDAIANSPIVESSTNVRTLLGAAWAFGGETPPRRVRGKEYAGPPLWSWRVHWAYQLKHNIFPVAMTGYWTKSIKVPDTLPTQTGFTLGRKLRVGKRADVVARAGVFRHYEKPFQENFNSYVLSVGAIVKSFDNFSDKVKFRWGVAMGLSYAETLPAEEVVEFIDNDIDSSRLLLYLEVTYDYALDRLIPWKGFENCFVGAIITHRSGVYGGSEVFGGVAGGTDWGGFHLECMR